MGKVYHNAQVGDSLLIDGHKITIIANPKRHVRVLIESDCMVEMKKKQPTDSRAQQCHSLNNTEV